MPILRSLMFVGKAKAYPIEELFRCSTLRQAPGLTHKQQTTLERLANDKDSNLLRTFNQAYIFYNSAIWIIRVLTYHYKKCLNVRPDQKSLELSILILFFRLRNKFILMMLKSRNIKQPLISVKGHCRQRLKMAILFRFSDFRFTANLPVTGTSVIKLLGAR